MEKIIAAGGVLFKVKKGDIYVLLIYRRGVWDLPKGKLEKGEDIEECAIREVKEEVGCSTPKSFGKLTTTYHEYEESGVDYGKTTHWYAMKTATENDFTPEVEEDIQKVAWVSLEKAVSKVGYNNLKEVLVSFKEWYTTTS
ncbi:MAG: NUDIX domain-containing protein [Balneolaceae bacterium]|nr:NUDIX domain-containing protein [Balneolaceae bacterium]